MARGGLAAELVWEHGFEHGYRAVTSTAPSNAAERGDATDADERLASILGAWGRLIAMVHAARLAAFAIAALALLDRMRPMAPIT